MQPSSYHNFRCGPQGSFSLAYSHRRIMTFNRTTSTTRRCAERARLLAPALALLSLPIFIACSSRSDHPAPAGQRVQLTTADSSWVINAEYRCFPWRLETALRRRDEMPVTACVAEAGDVVDYFYRLPAGQVFAHGHQRQVTRDIFRTVADSLEQQLTARYGRGQRCRSDTGGRQNWIGFPLAERYVVWRDTAFTIQLITFDSGEPLDRPSVALEVVRGELGCFTWLNQPLLQ